MSNRLKKLVSVTVCVLLSCIFIIAMRFAAPSIPGVENATGTITYLDYENREIVYKTAELGKDLAATRISSLGDLGRITKVNYVADKFVYPRAISPEFEIVDLDKPFEFAAKGTLMFFIFNLDPESEDYIEQTKALDRYKEGDYWNFALSLPAVFGASNIYLDSSLSSSNGEIEGYNFIDFCTSYNKVTEKYEDRTARTDVSLRFYTRREIMTNALGSARIITVHYQSTGSFYSGLKTCPLIGEEGRVKSAVQNSQTLLICFAILAAVMFSISAVLSLLKRTLKYVPESVWTFGIFFMLLSRYAAGQATGAPLLWAAVSISSAFIVLGGALVSFGVNCGRLRLKYVFPALMLAGFVLSFLQPYVSYAAAKALAVASIVIKASGAAALAVFIGLAVLSNDKGEKMKIACASVIDVAIVASLFLPHVFPAVFNSMFWACVATVFLTLINVFILFGETEKANAYLTNNLHREVERQIKEIKDVIAERDSLLQFVSHDMKKPLVSSSALIETLLEREKDGEQLKALRIVRQNNERVISNLSGIGQYAKFNYIAEPSSVADLFDVCDAVCKFHYPDCNANGIVLKNAVDRHCKVFIKRQGLENAMSDIILNAIEHANCSTITLSIKTNKNRAVLCIADDGKGVDEGLDIFKPYVSADKPDTGGLGLYICKNIVEAMNGELAFTSAEGNTVFYISLLTA